MPRPRPVIIENPTHSPVEVSGLNKENKPLPIHDRAPPTSEKGVTYPNLVTGLEVSMREGLIERISETHTELR